MVATKKDQYILLSTTISFSLLLLLVSFLSSPIFVFGTGQNPSYCWEIGTCDLFKSPLDAMFKPWTDTFGPIAYVIVWGLILGVIWLKTHHTMLVGIVGLAIASLFTIQGLNSINPQILYIGGALLAVAGAIVFYQLITGKLLYSSN
jgi:hypothetical protein